MDYDPDIEIFRDFVDFTNNDECVWIVYPVGAAGDLVASIISLHYASPAAKFLGITNSGQVIFRDSGHKNYSINYNIEKVVNDVNHVLSTQYNTNYSKVDQIILSNHGYRLENVEDILAHFPNAKIIRITPANSFENDITNWLGRYKNKNIVSNFIKSNDIYYIDTKINDPRVLNLNFSDIINKEKFILAYDKIIKHLNLKYKLINYDFILFWLSKQHPNILPILSNL